MANVRSLGGSPIPVGLIGEDEAAGELIAELQSRGIDTGSVVQRAGLATPTKTRILGGRTAASRQQIVRVDAGDAVELTDAEIQALLDRVEAAVAPGSDPVLVFSDYGYGVASPELHAAVCERLGPGVTTLVDSRYRLHDYDGASGATPNQEEAEELAGAPLGNDAAVCEGGQRLLRSLGTSFLLITRGRQGMALLDASGTTLIPIYGTDQVVDVTGAGDTVIGTFALAVAAQATPLEAALLANYAGGLAVMKAGTAAVAHDDLARAIRAEPHLLERVTHHAGSS